MANDMIFISYSRQDKAFVDALTNDLKQAGFNIWRDTESLVAGTASWERAIRQAIKARILDEQNEFSHRHNLAGFKQ